MKHTVYDFSLFAREISCDSSLAEIKTRMLEDIAGISTAVLSNDTDFAANIQMSLMGLYYAIDTIQEKEVEV